MKNRMIVAILIIILPLIFVFDYFRVKNYYEKANSEISENINNSKYSWYFDDVFTTNNEQYLKVHTSEDYIKALKPLFNNELSKDEIKIKLTSNLQFFFIDPFSKQKKDLKYYPIYNSNEEIKGYVLLSSGIDGEINNHFDLKLYHKDYKKSNFKLYDEGFSFSYFDYYFGKKDIIVSSDYREE
jgi:hypothetical protein